MRAGGRERLHQTGAQPLTGQLDQAQRGHLGHLVAGPVPAQGLGQPAQHQIAVRLEHHVDEVDDHDAADVAQPQLPDDLFRGLEVVLGDGLLEVATGTGELAGVDVDDGHRLGPVDHQGAARGQPHLAVHGLGQLLVDAVHREHIRTRHPLRRHRLVLGELRNQFRRNRTHVLVDGFPGVVAVHDQPGEILVEQVADDLDQDVGLLVEGDGGAGLLLGDLLGLGVDLGPALLQAGHIAADVLFLHAFRRGADDDTGVGRDDLAQDLLEPLAFGVGQLAADTRGRRPRDVHQIPAGQRDLGGQPGALVPDRILADLYDDIIAGLEGLLDLALGTAEPGGLPVHLTGVQHAVAAAPDVDEGRLHGRQDVLHDAEVDIAHQGCRGGRGHEVLDHDAVLEHGDLRVAGPLVRGFGADLVAHDHRAFDGLATGQELGLAQDGRTSPAGVAAVAAALPLGLEPGRSADALDLVGVTLAALARFRARGAFVHDGVGGVVGGSGITIFTRSGLAPPAAPAAAARAVPARGLVVAFVVVAVTVGIGLVGRPVALLIAIALGVGIAVAGSLAATPAATAATTAPVGRLLGLIVLVPVVRGVRVVAGFGIVLGCRIRRRGGRRRGHRRRCDEQGQVVGGLAGFRRVRFGGLEQQPGFRLGVGDRRFLGGLTQLGVRGLRQHVTDPNGIGAVDAGMRAAGATVELAQCVEHLAAGGAEHPGQRMHPQAFGQVRIRAVGCQFPRFGEVFGVIVDRGIVGHVVSSSPRARPDRTRPRKGFRYSPDGARRACMVSPRAALGILRGTTPGAWVE